jgi:protein TonB
MLQYATGKRDIASRPSSPNAMLVIISIHVAVIAALMSAKMDVGTNFPKMPPLIQIPVAPVPPPNSMQPPRPAHPQQQPTIIDPSRDLVRPQPSNPAVEPGPPIDPTPIDVGGSSSTPSIPQPPVTTPIHRDALLLTPESELRPPYPASKLASEEEATLRLRLTIDPQGRVVDVQPVGRVDSVFFQAARRYLIAHWRYQAATEDGRAVSSSTTITLKFQLDS